MAEDPRADADNHFVNGWPLGFANLGQGEDTLVTEGLPVRGTEAQRGLGTADSICAPSTGSHCLFPGEASINSAPTLSFLSSASEARGGQGGLHGGQA